MIIENIPQETFYYLRRTGPFGNENYQLMTALKEIIREDSLNGEVKAILGISIWNSKIEKSVYDVGFTSKGIIDNKKLGSRLIKGGKYAVFVIPHTVEAVSSFWQEVASNTLFKTEDFIIDDKRDIMERYEESFIKQGLCEFCIPVTSKIK